MSFVSLKDQGWYDRGDRMAESLGVLTKAGKKLFEKQPADHPPPVPGLGGAPQPAGLRPQIGGMGLANLSMDHQANQNEMFKLETQGQKRHAGLLDLFKNIFIPANQ
jgi:hypothetical protein